MPSQFRYPIEMKRRARVLKEQGLSISEVREQLTTEFPKEGEHLRSLKNGGEATVNQWLYGPYKEHNGKVNNKIKLNDEELGIVEQFALVPRATSDKFNDLTQSIPELLAEKREELERIKKQIHQLEQMSKVLGEELEEDEQPELATG